jgi:hypothetical protein
VDGAGPLGTFAKHYSWILVVVKLWPHISQNIGDSLILLVRFWPHLPEHFGLFNDAGARNLIVNLALLDL